MSGLRGGLSSGLSEIRANLLESILLLFACATIALAMYKTVSVGLTGDRAQDLTFAGTTSELGRALAAGGPSHVGRLDEVVIAVGTASTTADTIIAVADSVSEPAFAKGGFVRDQIGIYNDYAVRHAVLSFIDGSRGNRGRLEAPALLRTTASEDGTRTLSDRPSPYGMVIRSPYAEGSWREVRTSDWRSSPALLGYDGQVLLPADSSTSSGEQRLNGRDCGVNREVLRYFLYCQSALAAGANKFYDFSFLMATGANGGSFGSAGTYRQRSIWMNGHSEIFGQREVNGGDVFDVASLGSFLLSTTEQGTLAAEQWVNGRQTFANTRLGTLTFFAPAGRSTASTAVSPLVLSFDAALSADLDREASRFLAAHNPALTRMVVVVLDVRSGEVKAIAEPARISDDEPLLSFEPILVGSVVKPILASAILSKRPALGDLTLRYAGDTVTNVAGIQLTKGFANDANGCAGQIDFAAFLRCSSNQYAAEFMVRSLQLDGLAAHGDAGTKVPRAVLERSAIATGLADVFDVDAYANRTAGRLALYWNPDSGGTAGVQSATTDRTLIPYESRPWILFADSGGTRVDLAARYAFGGWEDRWTLLGLAQAYARIATDHNVQATFLHRKPTPGATSSFAPASPAATAAFARVRKGLRQVGVNGTAAGVSEKLQAATHQPLTILAKTGTLNESAGGGRLKSLVIAMGLPTTHTDDAPLGCGLVAVTYFEFAEQPNNAVKGLPRAALPRIHRDFAEGPFAEIMSRHWKRVSGCTQPPAPAGGSPAPRTVSRK